ncbi:MAG: hypothetical protein K0S07_1569 [Chlamydiales bacterium]|nr:hypothetical protein [Chlamydiales bacterium]
MNAINGFYQRAERAVTPVVGATKDYCRRATDSVDSHLENWLGSKNKKFVYLVAKTVPIAVAVAMSPYHVTAVVVIGLVASQIFASYKPFTEHKKELWSIVALNASFAVLGGAINLYRTGSPLFLLPMLFNGAIAGGTFILAGRNMA